MTKVLMEEPTPRLISHKLLAAFCRDCFIKLGLSSRAAEITADNLIFANLRGVDSHGVIRLKIYADRLRAGGVQAQAQPEVVCDTSTYALIDAHAGVGQVACAEAMKLAIHKASRTGLAMVGIKNSNHFGAAAYFARMALDHGMIGIVTTNAGATMAPSGGREARLGNNPMAIAVPAANYPPVILDMATGAAALGKIFIAQQENKKIPLTWALDKEGLPTDDPAEAVRSMLVQPVGGYKGYGLSLMLDILTGVLCGGVFSNQIDHMYKFVDRPTRLSHLCLAVRIDLFMPADEFRRRVDQIVELMHCCPPASGVERIYVPGEIEHELEQQRSQAGIPISRALEQELRTVGAELGVTVPF